VRVRRGLPATVVERMGGSIPARVEAVVAEAQPDPRDADELHDLLLDVGALPRRSAERGWADLFEALVARPARRAPAGEPLHWVAAERRSVAAAVWPDRRFTPDVVEPPSRRAGAADGDSALAEIVRGTSRSWGPTTGPRAIRGAPGRSVIRRRRRARAASRWKARAYAGRLRWSTRPDEATQWCDRRLLARINRHMLDGLRRAIRAGQRGRLSPLPVRLATRASRKPAPRPSPASRA
jgi:ATP-dependent Lhr-like helicase